MGSVVVVPTISNDESFAFAVMQRPDGEAADSCLDPRRQPDCIVAKRQLRFVKRARSNMRVDMRISCLGIGCAVTETCVKGTCVHSESACGASCDEDVLLSAQTSTQVAARPDAGTQNPGPSAGVKLSEYTDMVDASYWSTFDVGQIGVTDRLGGGAFDGRFVYLSPGGYTSKLIGRYDTRAPLAESKSWSTHDAGESDWGGSVFDGRFVYFLPGRASKLLRFDTTLDFNDPTAWTTSPQATSDFQTSRGGVFDGRHLYVTPTQLISPPPPLVVRRYDVQGAFGSVSSFAQLLSSHQRVLNRLLEMRS